MDVQLCAVEDGFRAADFQDFSSPISNTKKMPDVELVDLSSLAVEKSQADSPMEEAIEKPSFDPVHPKDMMVRSFVINPMH